MSTAQIYWHLPQANEVTHAAEGCTFEEARKWILHIAPHVKQYVAIIQHVGIVTRYLVTKGAGIFEVIPMESKWNKEQEMLSNILNFVTANDELPLLPGEDEDEDE